MNKIFKKKTSYFFKEETFKFILKILLLVCNLLYRRFECVIVEMEYRINELVSEAPSPHHVLNREENLDLVSRWSLEISGVSHSS